jgi:hypothetical protein
VIAAPGAVHERREQLALRRVVVLEHSGGPL